MQILLKNILKEIDEPDTLKTQIYMDLDGVLADLDKAFKKASGGYTADTLKDDPQFKGDIKLAKKRFWQIASKPEFFFTLSPKPDALVLWQYVNRKFTDPKPVVLTAGQGSSIQQQKIRWVHKHLGPNVTVLIANKGAEKPNHIIEQPNTRHILIDDMKKNIDVWNAPDRHRFGILHKNAAESIRLLDDITK
jgi:5'(3')-deoxyribonucleotidase